METRPMEHIDASLDEVQKFRSPEEEIAFLREQVARKEKELEIAVNTFEQGRLAKREIQEYAETPPAEVLHETVILPEFDAMREALNLEPEEHDQQIDALLHVVAEKGVRNALSVASKMNSPHIEDDFHRVLIQYIAEGLPVKKGMMPESQEMWKALHMTLYEVQPAGAREEGAQQTLEQSLATMEQLYSGLVALASGNKETQGNVFSMEIAVSQGAEDVYFYIAVPRAKTDIFERHVLSIFPDAKLTEQRGDYNIFNENGESVGAYGTLAEPPVLPIRTYQDFEHDPMNVVLSAFSNLAKHGDGAALQIVVGNEGDRYNKYYRKILREVTKGKKLKEAMKTPETQFGEMANDFGKSVVDSFSNKEKSFQEPKTPEEAVTSRVQKKVETRIMPATIRILASSKDDGTASGVLENLASTFNQFADPQGNSLVFEEVKRGKQKEFFRDFAYRLPKAGRALPLNLSELTTLFHLTAEGVSTSRELRKSKAKQAPAPIEMGDDGITIGVNRFGGKETKIQFAPQDRLRHFYIIGQTGTGKSVFMQQMIIQDILNGEGICYIDPHGSDIIEILAAIPPERRDDIIYFDPSYTPMPMGLNMLEFDQTRPEQKTFVVDELFGIFQKLYGGVDGAVGPAFEQYFRNATLLVMSDPASGNTMVDITRVFANEQFRAHKLSRCDNPLVVQFWRDIAEKTQGEQSLENFAQYVTNKFDVFLANEIMRPIVAQEKSSFNFREIMDTRKILLVNLSKGMLGDMNASLIGLIFVGKILLSALGRADSVGKDFPPFYLYLDEFQNITTPSIETIFSEARKYKLSLTVAHQFIDQLEEGIRNSVFGNVGSKCSFRVGVEDAAFLEKTFEPEFVAKDIAGLDNRNAYVSMLIGGKPSKPFSMETLPRDGLDFSRVEEYKHYSYNRYGRPRAEIEAEIMAKYQKKGYNALDPSNLGQGVPYF